MTTDLSGFCSPSVGGQGVGNNNPYGGHPSRCDQTIPWGNRGGAAWGNGSTSSSGGGGGAKGAGNQNAGQTVAQRGGDTTFGIDGVNNLLHHKTYSVVLVYLFFCDDINLTLRMVVDENKF